MAVRAAAMLKDGTAGSDPHRFKRTGNLWVLLCHCKKNFRLFAKGLAADNRAPLQAGQEGQI
jgi:hypothetical protein